MGFKSIFKQWNENLILKKRRGGGWDRERVYVLALTNSTISSKNVLKSRSSTWSLNNSESSGVFLNFIHYRSYGH